MKLIIFLASFLLYQSTGCLRMDIVLLGDLSGSCLGKEKFVADAFRTVVEKIDIGEENVKVGVVTFNSTTTILSKLSSDKEEILKAVNSIKIMSAMAGTNTYLGLNRSLELLFSEEGRNVKKLIIIVTDAQDDNTIETRKVVKKAKDIGVIIAGVLIDNGYGDEQFMKEMTHYYRKADYESLAEEIKKLDVCL